MAKLAAIDNSGMSNVVSAYSDYWGLRMAIWDSKEPLVVKAMALAVLEHMRPDMIDATVSRRRVREMCGISENTLERHWGAIAKWIDVIKAKGKASIYRARIHACASELVELIPSKVPPTIGGAIEQPAPIEVAPTIGVPPTNYPTQLGYPPQTTPLDGGYTTPHDGGYSSPYIESNNNYPSKGEEEEEGARERADAKPLVYANGTAFEGPGFRLEYELIRLNGAMIGFSDEKSKLIGELVAWQWATSGFVPQSVPYAFQKALANRKIRLETTESKIKIEIDRIKAESSAAPADRAPPSAGASPSGRRHWRDEQAENDLAGIRALEEVRAKRLAKS